MGLYTIFPLMLNYVYLDNFVSEGKFFLIQSLGSVFIFLSFIFLNFAKLYFFVVIFGFIMKFGLFPVLNVIVNIGFSLH